MPYRISYIDTSIDEQFAEGSSRTEEFPTEPAALARARELFAEGDRWYDLTRTNTFLTVIPKAVNNVYPTRTPLPRNRYFPIPLDEVHANPELTQNPDWQ